MAWISRLQRHFLLARTREVTDVGSLERDEVLRTLAATAGERDGKQVTLEIREAR